jgi:hypothetical protein
MKRAGMLSATTDVDELAKKAFVHFDDVSDKWLESLEVETVAGDKCLPMRISVCWRSLPQLKGTRSVAWRVVSSRVNFPMWSSVPNEESFASGLRARTESNQAKPRDYGGHD